MGSKRALRRSRLRAWAVNTPGRTALHLRSARAERKPRAEPFCPDGSKIGTVKIRMPLLPNPIEGAVYLAAQEANPFGSLVAMYIVAEDPVSGTVVKLTGKVSLCENPGKSDVSCETRADRRDVQEHSADDPFEEAELHFFGGERAPLRTPSHVGRIRRKRRSRRGPGDEDPSSSLQ